MVGLGPVVVTRFVVTGSAGFCGRQIAAAFTAAGCEVVGVDLVPHPGGKVADVRDLTAMRRLFVGADVVVHAAAAVPLVKDAELIRSINVVGTRTVLAAAADAAVGKVVLVSSSAVFGRPGGDGRVDEATRLEPVEVYGWSKLAAEREAGRAVAAGLDVSVVRPRTTVGPGRGGIFGSLFGWVAAGRDPVVAGDGGNVCQLVHVDDLADAIVAVAGRPGAVVVNVGAGDRPSMADLFGAVCEVAGGGCRVRRVPVSVLRPVMAAAGFAPYQRAMFSESFWFDPAPALREVGWLASRSSIDTIIDAYTGWRCVEQGDGVHSRPFTSRLLDAVSGAVRVLPAA